MIKNLPAMQETWVQSLGREDPLEEGMATRSRTEEPAGNSPWSHKESDTTERLNTLLSSTVLKEQAWSSCSELIPCL